MIFRFCLDAVQVCCAFSRRIDAAAVADAANNGTFPLRSSTFELLHSLPVISSHPLAGQLNDKWI